MWLSLTTQHQWPEFDHTNIRIIDSNGVSRLTFVVLRGVGQEEVEVPAVYFYDHGEGSRVEFTWEVTSASYGSGMVLFSMKYAYQEVQTLLCTLKGTSWDSNSLSWKKYLSSSVRPAYSTFNGPVLVPVSSWPGLVWPLHLSASSQQAKEASLILRYSRSRPDIYRSHITFGWRVFNAVYQFCIWKYESSLKYKRKHICTTQLYISRDKTSVQVGGT